MTITFLLVWFVMDITKCSKPPLCPKESEVIIANILKGDLFYVYSHEYNGDCFYIGKGKGDRAWNKISRNELWLNHVSDSMEYEVKIIAADLTESDALAIEKALILSRQPKCNIMFLF